MNWYLAKIVYQIICGDGEHTAQFDEQLRLINATDRLQAYLKAKHIGISEEDNFLNDVNKPVRWKFIDVEEIHPLSKLVDCVELYSRISEEEDAEGYIRYIKSKSGYLLETSKQLSPALN